MLLKVRQGPYSLKIFYLKIREMMTSPKVLLFWEKNLNSGADLSCVPVVSCEAAVTEHILQ